MGAFYTQPTPLSWSSHPMSSSQSIQANSKAETPSPEPGDEFQNLLLSLPSEVGPEKRHLYLYKGFWYPPSVLQATMEFQKQFQAHPTDIILVTTPKSGTTWLKSLLFAITQRTQYPVSNQNHPLLTNNPHALVPFLPGISTTTQSPRLFASHVPYSMLPESFTTLKCRFIYLCRNPKDILVSMWYMSKKISPSDHVPLEEFVDKFCKGISWFGPCWDQALEFWKLSLERPEEVLFLKYEDLKDDTISNLKNMAEYLGYPFSLAEENEGVINEIIKLCSFEHLSNLDVNKTGKVPLSSVDHKTGKIPKPLVEYSYFFRKGEVGDWMNVLTPSMAEQVDQVLEQKLHGSGLAFT